MKILDGLALNTAYDMTGWLGLDSCLFTSFTFISGGKPNLEVVYIL